MADLIQDVRDAARLIRRQPILSAAAVAMLALGIGATTAVFSLLNGVLLNPLPYRDPDELVRVVHTVGGSEQPYFGDPIALAYADNSQAFADLGVWADMEPATVTGRGDPEEVRSWSVSRGVLTTLGVETASGRWFSAADDTPGAADVVVIGHAYWQRRFGGDAAALAQTLTIDGRPHQIVGVLPPAFRFPGDTDVLLPLRLDRGRPVRAFRLLGVARLAPGVTLTQGNTDASRILQIWLTDSGQKDPAVRARYQAALRPLVQDVVGDIGPTLWLLMAAIAIVLLMACANVATLLLARTEARRQELAVRAALGARWTRLARHLLVESLVLAVAGGALGLALAAGGLRLLVATGPANLPRLSEVAIDPRVMAFAAAVSVLSGLAFALLPIVRHTTPRTVPALDVRSRGASRSRDSRWSQQVLVAAQIALALVLLVSAGLMIRSALALRGVDPGFAQPQHLQAFTVSIPPLVASEPERVTRLQQEVLDKVAAIPGVTATAFTTRVPMDPNDRFSAALRAEDIPDDGRTPPNHQVKMISPGLFQAMGTPIVAGRDFSWTDVYEAREVAIVSAGLARDLWGSPAAALGKRVCEYYSEERVWREIVGVAGDVSDDGAHVAPPPTVYWPGRAYAQLFGMPGFQQRRVVVLARSERAGTAGLVGDLRRMLSSVDPRLALAQVRTAGEVYDASMARTSFTLAVLTVAGTMALLLGVVGIYGVIAYAVSQRRREIGIRMALGARAGEVLALVMRQGLWLSLIGVAGGLGAAAALAPLMRSLLFGVRPLDAATFVAVAMVLTAAALLATYLPARRAAAVDPIETLRAE